jgi:hypothetical protein
MFDTVKGLLDEFRRSADRPTATTDEQ